MKVGNTCRFSGAAGFQRAGDWCKPHGVPESQCLECHQWSLHEDWYGDDLDLWLVDLVDVRPRRLTSGGGVTRKLDGGAVAWSLDLLPPWEVATLAQAAVFRGGFDTEAAREVIELAERETGKKVVLAVVWMALLACGDSASPVIEPPLSSVPPGSAMIFWVSLCKASTC